MHHSLGSKHGSKIEWKLTWHCCKCCNPAKGKVDFEDSWLIKSSFTTKDEMKANQDQTPTKEKKRIKEFSDDQDKRTNKKHCIEATEQAKGALAFRFISEKKKFGTNFELSRDFCRLVE